MSSSKSFVWLCLALAAVTMISGCSGCNQDPLVKRKKTIEDEKKKKEKPKEDFELKLARTVPADDTIAAPLVKPGHWVTVANEIKANNFNFQADLYTTSTDRNERPIFVQDTPFMLSASRGAPLPKGQEKRFETIYFVPRAAAGDTKSVGLHRELRALRGGRLLKKDWQPLSDLKGYQYFLLVLATEPDAYGYLKRLPSVSAPTSEDFETETYLHYRVLLPTIDRIAPLPSNSLTWTSIAYILWDDADPGMLTPDQQQAMFDWLNWGGQLIISGPNSLERLKGSFLDKQLPALAAKTIELDQAAIDEINEHWALRNRKSGEPRTLNVLPGQPLVGVDLELRPDAAFVPGTGQLVAERRIGAGRIVATAFSLTDRTVLRWTSYDGFFNACLLRRPPREFRRNNLLLDSRWADYSRSETTDARLVTTLRYFTRDIGHYASRVAPKGYVEPGEAADPRDTKRGFTVNVFDQTARKPDVPSYAPPGDDWHFVGYPPRAKSGMAAWNDNSGASDAAREALKVAAGISIPKGDFVLKVLAIYLLVLAPVNWAFFRLMGRVEWAWIAAPIMAVIGAVAVVRLAQLDIGFARSITEVAVLETQGDYPRAHATRYTAMYTSLSSTYDLIFDDESSLAQPFGVQTGYVVSPHDPTYTVSLRRDRNLVLRGFQVASNSTGTVHCEQMTELGGVFSLVGNEATGWHLNNSTKVAVNSAGVLRRDETGQLQRAWVGDLAAGSTAPVTFEPTDDSGLHFPGWDESEVTLSLERQTELAFQKCDADGDGSITRAEATADPKLAADFDRFDSPPNRQPNGAPDGTWTRDEVTAWARASRVGELSVGRLLDLASEGLRLRNGDVRMIGWSADAVPGMTIRPSAAQEARRTLILVHLKRGGLPAARPDRNAAVDFAEERAKAQTDKEQPAAKTEEPATTQPGAASTTP